MYILALENRLGARPIVCHNFRPPLQNLLQSATQQGGACTAIMRVAALLSLLLAPPALALSPLERSQVYERSQVGCARMHDDACRERVDHGLRPLMLKLEVTLTLTITLTLP